MIKKLLALAFSLILLLTAAGAPAEGWDDVALTVGGQDFTADELKSAVTLHLFEGALQCAGYGYGYDIYDPLHVKSDTDVVLFDLKMYTVVRELAEEMGVYPLSAAAMAAAEEEAEQTWNWYAGIAASDRGRDFLPGSVYEHIEGDPDGNLVRYFASFGLTKDALLSEAVRTQTDEELMALVTASRTDATEDENMEYYVDWFLEKLDQADITEDRDVIDRVIEALCMDPSEGPGDDDDGYERAILLEDSYYTLGESTVLDLEKNGWLFRQLPDGAFRFEVTEEGNYFLARTDSGRPDGRLVMLDLFHAYDLAYEYQSFGLDLAYDPEMGDIYSFIEEIYGGDYTDEGVLYARTEVSCGTLLIEISEGALRLTLEK